MAKIDKINWNRSDNGESILNVSMPVGAHRCANNHGDVLVVQALFKYLTVANRGVPDSECPNPNGFFDKTTERLIKKFQAKHHHNLLQDGIIHPARDHKYQWSSGKLWTIVLLNSMAGDSALLNNDGSAIEGIFKRFPQVSAVVDSYLAIDNLDIMSKNDFHFPIIK